MFVISLIINIVIFWLLFNLSWVIQRGKDPRSPSQPVTKSVLTPVALGLTLTVLDAMRVQFFIQIAILAVLAGVLYWAFSIFLRK